MTDEIVNAFYGYFETLYYLNQNLIKLCGLDAIDNRGQYERIIQDIIQAIPRLVPYGQTQGHLRINQKDGLLEYAKEIPFLKGDYDSLLQDNYEFLKTIKDIRNRFEHKMHGVQFAGGDSTSCKVAFHVYFHVDGERHIVNAHDLIQVIKGLNILFAKLQDLVKQFEYEKKENSRYYRQLTRCKFTDYNKIYESDVLVLVGKALFPF